MENNDTVKKTEKSGHNSFRRLILYMKPWWGLITLAAILSFVGSFLNVMAPGQMKNIVNDIQAGLSGNLDLDKIKLETIITISLIAGGLLCNLIQSFISPTISQHTSRKLRSEINEKTNRIPLAFFDTTPEGETLSTMTNDVDSIAASFGNTLPSIMISLTTLIGCIVFMFVTDWILALTTIVASFLGLIINMILMQKGMIFAAKKQRSLGIINTKINEAFRGHLVIKAFGAEKEVNESFNESNVILNDNAMKTQLISALIMPISTFIGHIGYVAVCVVGAVLVFNGHTQVGTIVAFIQYAQLFSNNLATLAQAAGTIQPAIASGGRIFAFLDQEEMSDKGTASVDTNLLKGHVEFNHVKFGYNPNAIIIHDFNCEVMPGQKVAIVGPTGSGKSTLINLLTRFYELNGGSILIDGVSIKDMPRENLHDLISMVLQETWTFEGSIRDNIVYAKENVTEDQLQKVCDDTGLNIFLKTFPDGIDTLLKEDCGISAGQKQLITIARAMLDDSPILILDEATSSVDTRTEKIISQAIDKLMIGRTSFVIAHRLSTIKNADLILVLKDGDIVETGNHNELMRQKGFYADLYMSQFDTNA